MRRHTTHTALIASLAVLAQLAGPQAVAAEDAEVTPEPVATSPPAEAELHEIIIQAPEPRYVAPTRRDRIGRIWAPVYINGKGPFRMVLDTGASHSGVIEAVATALNIPPNFNSQVQLRGVTGSAKVPTIRVDSLVMGDLSLNGRRLPILADALGGAEGILGTEGLADKRIYIDFRNDQVVITHSRGQRAAPGFLTVPVQFTRGKLLTVDAMMGSIKVKAIVDTGGQVTIANQALRNALARRLDSKEPSEDRITGATAHVQLGQGYAAPPIVIGNIEVRSSHVTFGDMHIFEHWKMTNEPAVLIGMDVLGLLDTLIIDYRRSELQIKMRGTYSSAG